MPNDNPDQMGPIVRNTADGKKQLVHARWGLPSPIFVQKKAAEARAEKLRAKGQAVDMDELKGRNRRVDASALGRGQAPRATTSERCTDHSGT